MSVSTASSDSSKKKTKGKTNEEIVMAFQKLRGEQRYITNKLSELELDLHEHRVVLDVLKGLDGNRKCYRMIGGVLCEKTVKDVIPDLKTNETNVVKVIDALNAKLVSKGAEINKFKEEHNLKFKTIDDLSSIRSETSSSSASQPTATGTSSGTGSTGSVLVS